VIVFFEACFIVLTRYVEAALEIGAVVMNVSSVERSRIASLNRVSHRPNAYLSPPNAVCHMPLVTYALHVVSYLMLIVQTTVLPRVPTNVAQASSKTQL